MTDEPETYKLEVLCNISMLRPIRNISFPQLGQRYLCPRDFKGRFKAFDKTFDEASLCCIRSWKIVQGVKNPDWQLKKMSKCGSVGKDGHEPQKEREALGSFHTTPI